MKKRILSILIAGAFMTSLTGCGLFETLGGLAGGKPTSFRSVEDLTSGSAYVWSHKGGNIKDDLKKPADRDVFFSCIKGSYNFKKKELEEATEYPRSIWVHKELDEKIPTVTKEDYLIYVSKDSVPEGIIFERFADYGYTIGVSNLMEDMGGHYYFYFSDTNEDDYKYFLDLDSDASQLTQLEPVTRIYLDKAGDVEVKKENVSDGGTVLGLTKDKNYVCEFYTGTYYQDFNLKADIHSFGSFERFVSYDYEFMHSNFIAVKIPEYFVSGYYYVQGAGLFRYVADADKEKYNGKPYDENINWNEPMILYNEDGTIKYDPSDPERGYYGKSDEGDNGDVVIDVPGFREEGETNGDGN